MDTETTIYDRFKQVRLMLNLSQEEFGMALGLSKSGISNIEKGVRGLRDTYINAICHQFGIAEQWLRYGEGTPKQTDTSAAFESFSAYLASLGFSIQTYMDSETPLIELSKDGTKTSFSEAEFEAFQNEVCAAVQYLVWKKNQQ